MTGSKKYGARFLAKQCLDDLLDIRDKIIETRMPMHEAHKCGLINSWLKVVEMTWKMIGADAAMMSDEAARTALERVGELFADVKRECPECGHIWGGEGDQDIRGDSAA